jgi:hypothetical protein
MRQTFLGNRTKKRSAQISASPGSIELDCMREWGETLREVQPESDALPQPQNNAYGSSQSLLIGLTEAEIKRMGQRRT